MRVAIRTLRGLSVSNQKRVLTDDGLGLKLVQDGYMIGDVTLEIDVDEIMRRFGPIALRSAGRKSVAMNGLVRIKATSISHVKPEEK